MTPPTGLIPQPPCRTVARRRLGPFEVGAEIAQGRRTRASLATHETLPGAWLLRELHAGQDRRDFAREVNRALEQRASPMIEGAAEYEGVMVAHARPIVGENLALILARAFATAQPPPLEISLAIAAGIASRLGHEEQRLVHGDLVPHHVLIAYDGTVHVTDPAGHDDVAERMHAPGRGPYRSPEHVDGKPLTPASDIFVLGVLFFELSTARPLFDHDSAERAEAQIRAAEYPKPRTLVRGYPIELQVLLRKMIRPDPEGRFPSGAAAREALIRPAGHRAASPPELGRWLRTELPDRYAAWTTVMEELGDPLPELLDARPRASQPIASGPSSSPSHPPGDGAVLTLEALDQADALGESLFDVGPLDMAIDAARGQSNEDTDLGALPPLPPLSLDGPDLFAAEAALLASSDPTGPMALPGRELTPLPDLLPPLPLDLSLDPLPPSDREETVRADLHARSRAETVLDPTLPGARLPESNPDPRAATIAELGPPGAIDSEDVSFDFDETPERTEEHVMSFAEELTADLVLDDFSVQPVTDRIAAIAPAPMAAHEAAARPIPELRPAASARSVSTPAPRPPPPSIPQELPSKRPSAIPLPGHIHSAIELEPERSTNEVLRNTGEQVALDRIEISDDEPSIPSPRKIVSRTSSVGAILDPGPTPAPVMAPSREATDPNPASSGAPIRHAEQTLIVRERKPPAPAGPDNAPHDTFAPPPALAPMDAADTVPPPEPPQKPIARISAPQRKPATDPLLQTSESELLVIPVADEDIAPGRGSRRGLWIALGLFALVIGGAAAVYVLHPELFSNSETIARPLEDPDEAMPLGAGGGGHDPGSAASTATVAEEPGEDTDDDDDDESDAELDPEDIEEGTARPVADPALEEALLGVRRPVEAEPPAPAPTSVRIVVFPRRARIKVDGERVKNGAEIQITGVPRVVEIRARGCAAQSETLEPGRTAPLEVMLRCKRRRRVEPAKKAKEEAAAPEASPEASPEAEPEASPEAEPEASPEAEPEASPEAEEEMELP